MTPIGLNLGCGPDYRDGMVNIDGDLSVRADHHADVTDHAAVAHLIADRPVEFIFLKHVLEHLPMAAVPPQLAWCHATLMDGGALIVDGPDLRAMCLRLAMKSDWTWEDVAMIYGGQLTPLDAHMSGWGHDMLERLFRDAGFRDVRTQRVDLCSIVRGVK